MLSRFWDARFRGWETINPPPSTMPTFHQWLICARFSCKKESQPRTVVHKWRCLRLLFENHMIFPRSQGLQPAWGASPMHVKGERGSMHSQTQVWFPLILLCMRYQGWDTLSRQTNRQESNHHRIVVAYDKSINSMMCSGAFVSSEAYPTHVMQDCYMPLAHCLDYIQLFIKFKSIYPRVL